MKIVFCPVTTIEKVRTCQAWCLVSVALLNTLVFNLGQPSPSCNIMPVASVPEAAVLKA